ncbi:hypothetical protein BDV36DRAFT_134525 [Aspergillus pseudocaelatus]|uniref:Uncharacterized protein n=1 Tax=Aspergillus pseudocaelatus TaxID=1825620 RepID=A0ABQ6WR02_9EURO|nr:hypothetical protein BDV36DRAFT_134525 [Aspergillus pseudocaelatus]
MSWDLKKRKLQALWSHINTSRSQFFTARHGSPSQPKGWRPFTLRPIYLTFLACLMFLMLLIVEGLRRYTMWYGGLVFLEATEEVSSLQSFAYNYIPIIVALILVTLWSLVDFDVLRLEPYFQLARPEGVPASVLFINYNFGQTFVTPFLSAKRGHWVALLVSIVTVLIRMFLPALQSTLLELREVTVISNEQMKTWPELVDLGTQANWIAAQERSSFDSINSAMASTTNSLQKSRSPDFAVPPVQIPTNDRRESTLWKVNQTIFWSQLSCHDLAANDALPVTINQTDVEHPILSWNVTGLPLVNGTNQDCSLDFQYDSIFYPETDFLQVRYWEPVWTTDTFDSGEVRKAFRPHGCDPFDLYGVLLSVNATTAPADAISSLGSQYISSATMFACDIEYRKATAEVCMHANSSITSVRVIANTTANLTSQEFNVDEFQGLLSHRAPYTSDIIFMQYNDTMGDLTVTELPVISQDMDDLEPMPVLDTATVMEQGEFEEKTKRVVIQAFVMTMGRLFNPDIPPTTVSAVRFAHQVTIAVVSFAATLSEAILFSSTLVALALLYFYQRRPNILQSDPGSIGAMCSMVTDLFSPSNILGNAQSDYHQLSTRQLRMLLRNYRLYWQEGPMGRRVELISVDGESQGSSTGLRDRIRTRVDPRPHFLVIPIFILEFLLLVAVIAIMALVIASLAHEGSFQHLTQSDSSFFQVILSFLPSVVASAVGALCNSIQRNISILEPWVHLQRGQAKARASLSMNYASQTPWLVLLKTIRDRHLLLGLVSLACVVNTVLTVVAGGLFTQQLTTSGFPTDAIQANYSNSIFKQTDFAADFTEYDLIQTSITSGVPMIPWTSPDYSFVPLKNTQRNATASYEATTLGIGADFECQELSISEHLKKNDTTGALYWQYQPFQNQSRQCTVGMFQQKNEKIPLSIHFLSPAALEDMDQCQTFTVLVLGRWNYTGESAITEKNTIALHCEPQVQMQNFSILFDQKGQIQDYDPVPNTAITSGPMYENATVSLGQFNKVFASIPQSFVDEEQQGPAVSSYDWAGFLVARLYKQRENGVSSLDPEDLITMSETVYQWVYSTYFSLWGPTYLEPLEQPYTATNATVYYSTWTMVPSVPSLTIALSIIALDTLVVLVVFGTRRGRFKGPRIPRSIGSVIPWIANSRMLSDFRGTYSWTSLQRRDYLERLNKRYAFRMFPGSDAQWRFAVDEEPLVQEDKPAVVTDPGALDPAKQPDAIELGPIDNDDTGAQRNHE